MSVRYAPSRARRSASISRKRRARFRPLHSAGSAIPPGAPAHAAPATPCPPLVSRGNLHQSPGTMINAGGQVNHSYVARVPLMLRKFGRVTVDDSGIRQGPVLLFFGTRFDVPWGDIKGWATT